LRSELARVQNRFEHEIAATKARYIRLTGRKPQLQGSHD
ncbi:MAG: hypothetical protein RI949_263, partial [Pseudomonadota bacterium]